MKKLSDHREAIDKIDNQILSLLSKRGKLAQHIGAIKKENGGAIHDPTREKSIYERLLHENQGPYTPENIRSIFREIISATRALEDTVRVSYLGPRATFTQMAAVKHFGSAADFSPVASIDLIFKEVESGHSHYGVVPIENSTEGVVSHTLDMFANSDLKVYAEVVLKVSQNLLSKETGFDSITKVYSHPQALAQCRNWLLTNLPKAVLEETESTAMAAKKSAQEPGTAAIASEIASQVYEIPILRPQIQDQNQNFTRFLVIGKHMARKTGDDKTSVLFVTKDEVGALYKILGILAKGKINLTKVESRPLKMKAWEYMFFADIDGHVENPKIAKALNAVSQKCTLFKILGSYPKSHARV